MKALQEKKKAINHCCRVNAQVYYVKWINFCGLSRNEIEYRSLKMEVQKLTMFCTIAMLNDGNIRPEKDTAILKPKSYGKCIPPPDDEDDA